MSKNLWHCCLFANYAIFWCSHRNKCLGSTNCMCTSWNCVQLEYLTFCKCDANRSKFLFESAVMLINSFHLLHIPRIPFFVSRLKCYKNSFKHQHTDPLRIITVRRTKITLILFLFFYYFSTIDHGCQTKFPTDPIALILGIGKVSPDTIQGFNVNQKCNIRFIIRLVW